MANIQIYNWFLRTNMTKTWLPINYQNCMLILIDALNLLSRKKWWLRLVLFLQDVKKFEWTLNMHNVGFFCGFLLLWVCWNTSNRVEIRWNVTEQMKTNSNLEIKFLWNTSKVIRIDQSLSQYGNLFVDMFIGKYFR